MLEIKGLHFRHPAAREDMIKGIGFEANSAEITALLGPNGSGKTTLFKCIAGLWKPQRGEVCFNGDGRDILNLSNKERARIFAVVPQDHTPPFSYSVLDAVLIGRISHIGIFSSPSKKDYLKAEEAIEAVGITHLKERPYTQISGGERQLVLIARALVQEAPIMLLDEPTCHLDFRNQILILNKIREIARQRGKTVLMSLHDPNLTLMFSDKAVLIDRGILVSNGKPESVITENTLKRVYDIDVTVINYNGRRLICPRVNRDD